MNYNFFGLKLLLHLQPRKKRDVQFIAIFIIIYANNSTISKNRKNSNNQEE